MNDFETPSQPKEMWEDKYGHKEEKDYVLQKIKDILRAKKDKPETAWRQPAELNAISNHWHNFDEETKKLILIAIPEVAVYILSNKIKEQS